MFTSCWQSSVVGGSRPTSPQTVVPEMIPVRLSPSYQRADDLHISPQTFAAVELGLAAVTVSVTVAVAVFVSLSTMVVALV